MEFLTLTLKMICKILQTFLNIACMVILVPIVSLVLLPFGLYRLLIRGLVHIFRPDVSMVPCRDTVFANDDFSNLPKSTIVVILSLKGDLELESIQNIAVQRMFGGNCSPSAKQKYAVLLQYFVNWGGFVFRKWEQNFDIKDHSREWRKPGNLVVTQEDVYELRRKLLTEPFKSGKSAWEAVLVRNYQESESTPKGSILLTKFHHGVVDGYSIVKLFLSTLTNIPEDIRSGTLLPVPHALSQPLSTLQNVAIFSKLFSNFIPTALEQNPSMDPDNIFHPNHPQTKFHITQVRHPVSTTIPLKIVKNSARQSGTSYTAVIMAGLTGGVRNYLISKNKNVPKYIDVALPLPWPGHDENKVQNHFTYAVIKIPTGLPDPLDRLQNLHDQFVSLKASSAPAFNYIMTSLVGMLPNSVMTWALEDVQTSIILSSIPGPNRAVQVFDRDLLTPPTFEGGYGKGPVGMGVSMLSYHEELCISINPEVRVVPSKIEAEELLQNIVNEIELIHDLTFV